MSKSQRTKGATFERDVANDLTADWGIKIKRNIGQARDGGDDITVPPFRIECKRRAGIAVYDWLAQCERACELSEIPVVIARADQKDAIVIMRYSDWKKLAREELLFS
jgi:hypothetical protein